MRDVTRLTIDMRDVTRLNDRHEGCYEVDD